MVVVTENVASEEIPEKVKPEIGIPWLALLFQDTAYVVTALIMFTVMCLGAAYLGQAEWYLSIIPEVIVQAFFDWIYPPDKCDPRRAGTINCRQNTKLCEATFINLCIGGNLNPRLTQQTN